MKKVESGFLLSMFSSIKRAIDRKQNSFLTETMFKHCILLKVSLESEGGPLNFGGS